LASHPDVAAVAACVRRRASLFDDLRATLRLEPRTAAHRTSRAPPGSPSRATAELRDIRSNLARWTRALRERRPARGPAQDEREAIDLVLDHLRRHGSSLFGHAIRLPESAGGGIRLVERTNNREETFFRDLKHGERRRSGRRVLTQDLEHLPASAALVPNLAKADYVAALCGDLDGLPAAFAALEAENQERCTRGRRPPPTDPAIACPAVESASLPASDRYIVRSEHLRRRIHAAARSRAPRLAGARR
jgi:hypothetical protein